MEDFDIFADHPSARRSDFAELMDLLRHQVEDHDMTTEEALGIVVDMLRPGNSDNSHDVRPIFIGALYALEHGDLGQQFESVYINTMPWGIGFVIATHKGFSFATLDKAQQSAIVRSLCVTLQAGGMAATVDDDNRIRITGPDGDTMEVDIDEIVSQFRTQLDEELGPDGPDDPMQQWMP
jgi:hypothetical protein